MPILAGSIPLLNVNPGLAIWTAVTFLVVLLILWRFAWKPIITAIDERNAKVADDLESSRQLREKAEQLLIDYEKKMESARSEAVAIIDEGKKDAQEISNRLKDEAKEEAEKIKGRVQAEINQAKLKALAEVEDRVVDLVVQVISKVMDKSINDDEHRGLIAKELENVKKQG